MKGGIMKKKNFGAQIRRKINTTIIEDGEDLI